MIPGPAFAPWVSLRASSRSTSASSCQPMGATGLGAVTWGVWTHRMRRALNECARHDGLFELLNALVQRLRRDKQLRTSGAIDQLGWRVRSHTRRSCRHDAFDWVARDVKGEMQPHMVAGAFMPE